MWAPPTTRGKAPLRPCATLEQEGALPRLALSCELFNLTIFDICEHRLYLGFCI